MSSSDLPTAETSANDTNTAHTDAPALSRRHFLGTAVMVGTGASLACTPSAQATPSAASGSVTNELLRKHVKNIVVIYGENRSFNNLFADFPGLEKPLSAVSPEECAQRDRDGTLLDKLPQTWGGVVHGTDQLVEGVIYEAGKQYQPDLPNGPFVLKGPQGEALPLGLIHRDLVHAFYHNQMQINGGKNDGFAAWTDAGGLTMGHHADTSYNLRLWDVAREFVLCDNFFQGAFGGSYLNHQYLVSAAVPFYPDVMNSPARTQVARLQSSDPADHRLAPAEDSPASAMDGPPKFGPNALTPDGYAVNTMAPPYWPSWTRDPDNPNYADRNHPQTLVPQVHHHIGDKLDQKGVEWAWYAGAWQATLDEFKDSTSIPKIPNFQYHHQPFNYFKNLGPENPEARAKHLRDGGLGDESHTNRFFADIEAGKLPAVTFYKPQGNLNMHAGYTDVASGDRHIAHAIKLLRASPQWKNMVVIVTVDENGGWWDHVAPPKGDRWGPGTRLPALVISPFAKKGTVDHTIYDTGSILRLITRVFDLEKLDGLKARDEAMVARGQQPMGDMTNALQFA